MKHVTRAVHSLMQDADAHDLLLNLYGRCFYVLPAITRECPGTWCQIILGKHRDSLMHGRCR